MDLIADNLTITPPTCELACNQRDTVFEELNESIILPLSQGSSELFHSNFLHFLAKKYPKFFNSVFLALGIKLPVYKVVKREYKHTDIIFYDADIEEYKKKNKNKSPRPVLIIENKMKSLPSSEQLEKYLEKLLPDVEPNQRKDCMVLLLPFSLIPEEVCDYKVITYGMLGVELNNHILEIPYEFTRTLVKKYADFDINITKALDKIFEPDLSRCTVGEYFNRKDSLMTNFSNLRFSSIAWKLRMLFLVSELRKLLSKRGFSIANTPQTYNKAPRDLNRLLVGVSMSNDKPITECFMYLNENIEFFIQLDNGVYNHGFIIKTRNGEAIKLIKNKQSKDKAKKKLLNQLTNKTALGLINKLNINKNKPLSYNNMFYSHVTYDENVKKNIRDMSLNEVINKIATEIIEIYEEYHKYSITK